MDDKLRNKWMRAVIILFKMAWRYLPGAIEKQRKFSVGRVKVWNQNLSYAKQKFRPLIPDVRFVKRFHDIAI